MPKMLITAAAVAFSLIAASPALAIPMCDESGSQLSFEFGFGSGDGDDGFLSSSDPNSLDMMRLQAEGIDTDRVERWNGCLRAYTPDGMRFFDPATLEEVF